MSTPTPADRAKYAAALRAADYVESGMKVGLGTGSTAAWLVRIIAQRVRDEGLQVLCVPTSTATAALAEELGITLITLEEAGRLDLTIDGADEVDGDLTLIKGGGAALLHEKIVATASDRMIVIADDAKAVQTLGAFPLPVEIIRFGAASTIAHVRDLLAELDIRGDVLLRGGNDPVLTDEGNYILDLHLGEIEHPAILAGGLNQIAGVVENGLFVGICDAVVLGDSDGNVRLRDEKTGERTTLEVDPTPPANLFQGDAK